MHSPKNESLTERTLGEMKLKINRMVNRLDHKIDQAQTQNIQKRDYFDECETIDLLRGKIALLESDRDHLKDDLQLCRNMANDNPIISTRTTYKKPISKQPPLKDQNKTKIIYTLQQETASLNNRLNKKELEVQSLKKEISALKKLANSNISQLKESILSLTTEVSRYKDKALCFDQLTKDKEELQLKIDNMNNESKKLKTELQHKDDRIREMGEQLNRGLTNYNEVFKRRLKILVDKVWSNSTMKERTNSYNVEDLLQTLEIEIEGLLIDLELSKHKYNKLIELHESVVDNNENGSSLYKIMDENQKLKNKVIQLRSISTSKIIDEKDDPNQEFAKASIELIKRVNQYENQIQSLEDESRKRKEVYTKTGTLQKNRGKRSFDN